MFDVGVQLRKLRKTSNLTLDQLALSSGVDRGTISRIELGHVSPRIDTIAFLCQAMDTSLSTFFGEAEPVPPAEGAPAGATPSAQDVNQALLAISKRNNFTIPPTNLAKPELDGYWPVPSGFWHGLLEVLERFETLVKNSRELILVVDADGRVLYGSPSCESLLGYRGAEVVGLRLQALVHPDHRQLYDSYFAQAIAAHPASALPGLLEIPVLCKDGSWRWLSLQFTHQLNNPSIRALVINGLDLTLLGSIRTEKPAAIPPQEA